MILRMVGKYGPRASKEAVGFFFRIGSIPPMMLIVQHGIKFLVS